MKTEADIRGEIDKVLADIENTKEEPKLQAHLNTVLEILLWVVGDTSMDEVLLRLVREEQRSNTNSVYSKQPYRKENK